MEKSECLCIPWNLLTEGTIFGKVYKILLVDLLNDSYEIIKSDDNEDSGERPGSLSEWFKNFAVENNIHPDDVTAFSNFTLLDHIKKHFHKSRRYIYVRYRRKNYGNSWKWATMDLFVYPQKKVVWSKILVIVRDIDKDYSRELVRQKSVETNCFTDSLTGLQNRFSYITRCCEIMEENLSVGVIYCDLNGLKFTNDNFGHDTGDRLLKSMSRIMTSFFRRNECFRTGGDEFIVLLSDMEKENFFSRVETFEEYIKKKSEKILIASSGAAWTATADSLEATVAEAEKIMYAKKKLYHLSEEGKPYLR